MEPSAERLSGGNTHEAIVRIGDTVRRPTGPWTPGVHALLRYLRDVGFEGSPRTLGVDDEGREILTFVEGTVVWPGKFELLRTDEALGRVAALIRRYHDAVAGFAAEGYEWNQLAPDPTGPFEVMCHNDLAAWNLVRTRSGWAFIDWDAAAPGRRAWDLGWALISFVPLFANLDTAHEAADRRLRVFSRAYGLDAMPTDVIDVAYERAASDARNLRERAARGQQPYARLVQEGHLEVWEANAAHIQDHRERWTTALTA